MCVCARVCLCVFVFVMRMYHGCFSRSIFEMENKNDFCFVDRCLRVCVCVCVGRKQMLGKSIHTLALTCTQSSFVCVCVRGCITDALWYRLLKWRAEGYSNSTSNFVSGNCKCGSVRWEMIRAAVTWALRCVCARVCLCVCVCVCVFVFLGRMYRGCVLRYIFEMKSKEVSNCQDKCCQRELQMQVRQL